MLVTGKNLQDVLQSYARPTATRSAEAGGRSATPISSAPSGGKRDTVQLSPLAVDVRRAIQELRSTPDVRQDLVRSLKRDIQSGTFTVDAEEIAKQLALVL